MIALVRAHKGDSEFHDELEREHGDIRSGAKTWAGLREALRAAEREYTQCLAVLEAVQEVANGMEVNDFLQSFPIVRLVQDQRAALRAAERARDEKEERIAGLRMDNARLIERIRIISHAETEAFDRAGAAESALQAKEQEIARLRAALVVPATYWREYFEAGDGSHSTHDEFWLQWLNEHSEQIQAVLASSGAETP